MSERAAVEQVFKELAEFERDAWERDRLDPANWLEIPEFGVLPESVSFNGFHEPIVYPGAPMWFVRRSLRDLVQAARTLARSRGSTLQELQAISMKFEERGVGEHPISNTKELDALRYFMFMGAVRDAVYATTSDARQKPEEGLYAVSLAGVLVAQWALNMPSTMTLTQLSQKGGRISGIARAPAKERIRECWQQWRAGIENYASKAEFGRQMVARFGSPRDPEQVAEWVRQWEKKARKDTP